MEDNDDKVIPGWHCGYCPIPGGIDIAPFFIFQMPKVGKRKDIISCKGIQNIPSNVRDALTALQYYKINKKSNHIAHQTTIIEEVIDRQAHALLLKQSCW